MKLNLTPEQVASLYTGKAVHLLDMACIAMGDFCKGCPMNIPPTEENPTVSCLKKEFIRQLST